MHTVAPSCARSCHIHSRYLWIANHLFPLSPHQPFRLPVTVKDLHPRPLLLHFLVAMTMRPALKRSTSTGCTMQSPATSAAHVTPHGLVFATSCPSSCPAVCWLMWAVEMANTWVSTQRWQQWVSFSTMTVFPSTNYRFLSVVFSILLYYFIIKYLFQIYIYIYIISAFVSDLPYLFLYFHIYCLFLSVCKWGGINLVSMVTSSILHVYVRVCEIVWDFDVPLSSSTWFKPWLL